jgi:hypothetical protein
MLIMFRVSGEGNRGIMYVFMRKAAGNTNPVDCRLRTIVSLVWASACVPALWMWPTFSPGEALSRAAA